MLTVAMRTCFRGFVMLQLRIGFVPRKRYLAVDRLLIITCEVSKSGIFQNLFVLTVKTAFLNLLLWYGSCDGSRLCKP